ncbi:MAG TPA: TonB-dependent receptor, partial [Bryobacterales bacterium]|nr:TonB-dependent receptor [Bryobacterales bacterium]
MKTRWMLFFSLCGLLGAQEFRATLSGRVTDPTGAVVAAAKVDAKAVATGAVSTTTTGSDGNYQIPFLAPGSYVITVEKEGFQRAVREGVQLNVAERATLDFSLSVGAVSESVTVSADTALVQTETADRGLTIESNRVENTPLQGRNIFAQAWSAPGITVTAAVQRLRPFDIAGSSSIAVSGGRPSGNEVLMDGVSNLAKAVQVAFVPSVEGTQEFKVQTTSYDAQYGWTTGGVVNMISKGGTNEWHGSAYEYLQNTHLDANTFDGNRNNIPRQSSHINTFGGNVGGPIRKDKIFVAFAYEDIRQVIPDPFVTSVPTALQKQGDFSQTYYATDASGKPLVQAIYNPFSTQTGSNGQLTRDAFPGNVIPPSMINPIAKNVFALIPLGNVAGNPVTALGNLVSSGSTRKFTDFFPEYQVRGDYNLSQNTRMFIRYSRNALAEERSFKYSTTSATNVADTSGNTPFKRENHSATVSVTRVLNPTTVLDFRFGLARFLGQSGSSLGAGYDLASLGFSPTYVSQAAKWFPQFRWANYEGAGAQPVNAEPDQTNSFQVNLAKTVSRHNLKTGVEFRLQRVFQPNPGYEAGFFNFDQGFTGANPLQITPTSGNALASFLLGTPSSGGIDVNSEPARQQRLWSAYIQDDIHVTRKFTLNAGLRWDYLGPLTDRFNALTRGFDTTSASPLKVPGLNVVGGLLYAGAGGLDRGVYDKHWTNFGPRLGAAYQLTPKTVLRGGYGLIYAQTFDDPGGAPGFNQQTAMVTSIKAGIPQNTLTNPFPDGILHPVGNTLGLATFLGQGFNFADTKRNIPYTHQFSFEIQRELPGQFLVTAAYVGSRIRRLEVNKPFNEISLDSLALGASTLTASVPNPFAGLIPGTGLNGSAVQRQQLLRPFPQFTGITQLFLDQGQSKYDGFQLMVYKRLSKGLNFSLAYTNSKTIDQTSYANAQDTRLEKVVASWDIPQNIQINGVYELPFGPGKSFGASAPAVVRRLIGGWQVSAITRLQEGFPMNIPSGAVPTGASPRLSNRTPDRWFNTCTLLPNGSTRGCLSGEQPVWTIRQPFQLQTWSSRLSSVRLMGIRNLDASVIKNNKIGERFNVLFRCDFLNATNTPQFFNGPVTDVNSGNFGHIAGAVS